MASNDEQARQIFAERFNNFEPGFHDAHWQSMQKKMHQRRRKVFYFWLVGVTVVVGLSVPLILMEFSGEQPLAQDVSAGSSDDAGIQVAETPIVKTMTSTAAGTALHQDTEPVSVASSSFPATSLAEASQDHLETSTVKKAVSGSGSINQVEPDNSRQVARENKALAGEELSIASEESSDEPADVEILEEQLDKINAELAEKETVNADEGVDELASVDSKNETELTDPEFLAGEEGGELELEEEESELTEEKVKAGEEQEPAVEQVDDSQHTPSKAKKSKKHRKVLGGGPNMGALPRAKRKKQGGLTVRPDKPGASGARQTDNGPFGKQHFGESVVTNYWDHPGYAGAEIRHQIHAEVNQQWPLEVVKTGAGDFGILGDSPIVSRLGYNTSVGKKRGFGFGGWAQRESNGVLTSTEVNGVVSQQITFLGEHRLRIGLQAGYFHRTLDVGKLTFGDQLDPRQGFIYETTEAVGVEMGNVNFATGLWYQFNGLFLAYSVQNLTQPNVAFNANNKSRLPREQKTMLGYRYQASKSLALVPIVRADFYNVLDVKYPFEQMSLLDDYFFVSTSLLVEISDKYLIGATYQNFNTAQFHGGLLVGGRWRVLANAGFEVSSEQWSANYGTFSQASLQLRYQFGKVTGYE